MAAVDDLNAAVASLTFNAYNNAPIGQPIITQLQAVAAQLSPGAPLSELQGAISQLQLAAPNNAPASVAVINELNDVVSQLLYGTDTSNPPDIQAIAQITNYILAQEPDWAPLLWMNWDGATTLTTQVRGFYTLVMTIAAVPWWTNWPTYSEAAAEIIAAIYLQQMATQAGMLMQATAAPSSSACPVVQAEDIAAPAVHSESWKNWSLAEGRQRAMRFVPEGCGVAVCGEELKLEELSSERIFDLPPRPPDVQAWWEANRAKLQPRRSAPRSSAPWNYGGPLYYWALGYAPPQHAIYMASFFGVSQVSTTNNVSFSIWPGLQPSGDAVVVQPVLSRNKGEPVNQWYMLPTIDGGGNQLSSGQFPIIMPQGVWGVIRQAGGGFLNGFYRGNGKNTGPNFNAPLCKPLQITFRDPTDGKLIGVAGGMTNPLCEVEVPVVGIHQSDGAYTCSDINITAVFGGVTLKQTAYDFLPVQWFHGTNTGAGQGVTCSISEAPIQNATVNGKTQLTVTIAGF